MGSPDAIQKKHASTPHYVGHRDRVRQKFLTRLGEEFAEYELLELLLFSATPRGDTKPLAKTLLSVFGNLKGVLEAQPMDLQAIPGIGTVGLSLIKVIQTIMARTLHTDMIEKPLLDGWRQVVAYCSVKMSHLQKEQLRILFLDSKNQLIQDDVQQEGTVDQAPLYIREIIQRALNLGASGLIVVHNHPSGDPTPSQADIMITHKLNAATELLNIRVLDHLIIGKGRHVSLKAQGLF